MKNLKSMAWVFWLLCTAMHPLGRSLLVDDLLARGLGLR